MTSKFNVQNIKSIKNLSGNSAILNIERQIDGTYFMTGPNTGSVLVRGLTGNTVNYNTTLQVLDSTGPSGYVVQTSSNIVPSVNNGADLGSLTNKFNNLYVGTGNINIGNNPFQLTSDNGLYVNSVNAQGFTGIVGFNTQLNPDSFISPLKSVNTSNAPTGSSYYIFMRHAGRYAYPVVTATGTPFTTGTGSLGVPFTFTPLLNGLTLANSWATDLTYPNNYIPVIPGQYGAPGVTGGLTGIAAGTTGYIQGFDKGPSSQIYCIDTQGKEDSGPLSVGGAYTYPIFVNNLFANNKLPKKYYNIEPNLTQRTVATASLFYSSLIANGGTGPAPTGAYGPIQVKNSFLDPTGPTWNIATSDFNKTGSKLFGNKLCVTGPLGFLNSDVGTGPTGKGYGAIPPLASSIIGGTGGIKGTFFAARSEFYDNGQFIDRVTKEDLHYQTLAIVSRWFNILTNDTFVGFPIPDFVDWIIQEYVDGFAPTKVHKWVDPIDTQSPNYLPQSDYVTLLNFYYNNLISNGCDFAAGSSCCNLINDINDWVNSTGPYIGATGSVNVVKFGHDNIFAGLLKVLNVSHQMHVNRNAYPDAVAVVFQKNLGTTFTSSDFLTYENNVTGWMIAPNRLNNTLPDVGYLMTPSGATRLNELIRSASVNNPPA